MNKHKAKLEGLKRRQRRVRGKVSGTSERPRLRVTRTNANIYAQIIDDSKGSSLTLVSASTLEAEFKGTHTSNKEAAEKVGQLERVMISGAAVIEIHQSFRLELISGCGNRVLQVFAESLLTECLRLLRETGESLPSDYLSDLITGDRRLLDAIKQGSMDEACEALNTVIQLEVAGAADDLRRGEAAAGSMDKKA